jgi:hypothetical protein
VDEVIRQLEHGLRDAVERGSWDDFRILFHPEVELRTTACRRYAGAEGLEEWWRDLRDAPVYEPTFHEVTSLGADGWFLRGRVMLSQESGGIADHSAAWLVILRDGLIWRSLAVDDEDEARALAGLLAPSGAPSG